jgi:hypothetical protein
MRSGRPVMVDRMKRVNAMSGRCLGPYAVKKRSPTTGTPQVRW